MANGLREEALHCACSPEKMLPHPSSIGVPERSQLDFFAATTLAKLLRVKVSELDIQGFKGSCLPAYNNLPRFSPQKFLFIILMHP